MANADAVARGTVFDVQNYCLYDGPGIRTCIYFKGCPLHCAWCHNPESIAPRPQMAYWRERCVACGRCVDVCPHQALRRADDHVARDPSRCDACGRCVEVCPHQAMERIGYETTVGELVARVEPDIPFFEDSGGGVTITGGEPTFQRPFLLALLGALRKRGISTCVETCGHFDPVHLERLADATDLVLFDLKHMDALAHRQGTGAGNRRARQNFARLVAYTRSAKVIPRMPVIPGFNTSLDSVAALVDFLASCRYTGPVHLMPYHDWALGKYRRLGLDGHAFQPGGWSESDAARVTAQFEDAGYTVRWGG